jgi:hypothetical protein
MTYVQCDPFFSETQSKSTRNIKIIMFLGSKVWPVRKVDNFTTI